MQKSEIGDVVILDADTNKVETPFDDLNNLPQEVVCNFIRLLPVSGPAVPITFIIVLDNVVEEAVEKQVRFARRRRVQSVSTCAGAIDRWVSRGVSFSAWRKSYLRSREVYRN